MDRVSASLANRSPLNRAVFSRVTRASHSYSVIAFRPSCARSTFLKLSSARCRALSKFMMMIVSHVAITPQIDFAFMARRFDFTSGHGTNQI
jgi:hypothetical protein